MLFMEWRCRPTGLTFQELEQTINLSLTDGELALGITNYKHWTRTRRAGAGLTGTYVSIRAQLTMKHLTAWLELDEAYVDIYHDLFDLLL